MLGGLKAKPKNLHRQGPEDILTAFQELWDKITFEENQMAFETWRDRLCSIIKHDREYVRK
jgi:hypothetical protein